jgi:glycosyltransferase involved in cell wall biosynthesis
VRVAIDYTAAVNQSAGIGRFVRSLIAALGQLDVENQYLLIHAAPNGLTEPSFPDGPNFRHRNLRLPQRYLDIVWQRLGLPLPVDWLTGPVDLFHSPDFVLPPVQAASSLLTVHDLAFLVYPECADARLRAYLERAVPRSVARADFVVTDSENTRRDVIRLLGVRPERVAVVYGGVDPSFRPIDDPVRLRALRERLGVGEAPFILAVGVIEPRKNLVRLFEAFERLRDRLHERQAAAVKLVVVGRRGWLWEDILARADRSPWRDEIIFPGFVPESELATLYSAAAVLAFPSLYEGFGLPILEAMACGTPVVASNSSSLPEVLGEAGLPVDPNDVDGLAAALELALLDEPLRAKLRQRGLAQAARFNWPAAARRLLQVYRRLATS